MRIRTLIVEGPLAMAAARLEASAEAAHGLQILDMARLAARLAGGFIRPASMEELELAIAAALQVDGYLDIERVKNLPGMIRAVGVTLGRIWRSGSRLDEPVHRNSRIEDLALIERRVRAALPMGALCPPDLADAALARLHFAPVVIGPVECSHARELDAVWHPLIAALSASVGFHWRVRSTTCAGSDDTERGTRAFHPQIVICPDPRSEVVDAMRWVRTLLSSGVDVADVALAAADPNAYDDDMLAMVKETGLPVRFSHGIPALVTPAGQTCAALADILGQGLSQDRVRRLIARLRGDGILPVGWPADGLRGIHRAAALTTTTHWSKALEEAASTRTDGFDPRALMPTLQLVSNGSESASRVGDLLVGEARELWKRSLRRSPAEAIAFRLGELRMLESSDASANVSWGPASHLAAAPRRYVRVLGMVAGGWPRTATSDPLLPEHLFGGRRLESPSITGRDRADFAEIKRGATGAFVCSRSKRTALGRVLVPSPLLPVKAHERFIKRDVPASHACSEADRLLARPEEAAAHSVISRATACWRARRDPTITAWDGCVRPNHPAVMRAYAQPQSATSLKLMLRDPLAFIWAYALGWQSNVNEPLSLELEPAAFGALVHEMLHRAVSSLEPAPGLAGASLDEREAALASATNVVAMDWPSTRAIPPGTLWSHSVQQAAKLARAALELDLPFLAGTRSWTELRFGQVGEDTTASTGLPWIETAPVVVPGTTVYLRGSIDRLDLLACGERVRLSDYKTGKMPKKTDIRFDAGRELQRTIYAIATLANLPAVRHVVSRLVHLASDPPRPLKLENVGDAIEVLATYLRAAEGLLISGQTLPGIEEAREATNPYRLALPATAEAYFAVKADALRRGFGDFAQIWDAG